MATFLIIFLVTSLTSLSTATSATILGVNYGTMGDNLPAPDRAIELIKSINGGGVRIYDTNSTILQAASRADLTIAVSIPNNLIISLANDQSVADTWVETNILPFGKRITYIFVGNEIFSDMTLAYETWPLLVPAMTNIYQALQAKKLKKIIVTTSFAMNCVRSIFPPSSAQFRTDIPDSIISSLLKFLKDTNSYFFINAYPYYVWREHYKNIALDFALLKAKKENYYIDSGANLTYTNLLNQMLDAVISAMIKLGYNDIKLGISETGWRTVGGLSETAANIYNAAMYNRNLAQVLAAHKGTPLRPGIAMPAYIFSLFNEDFNAGTGIERNMGLFYPNETAVYPIDLTGRKPIESYPPIPLPTNNEPFSGKIWCVMTSESYFHLNEFQEQLEQLCAKGTINCEGVIESDGRYILLPQACNDDPWLTFSYWINYIWQQNRDSGIPCYFFGMLREKVVDPSRDDCYLVAH